MKLLVYGREDPKPGNFQPRYGRTADFEAAVRQVTGKDWTWFFDVYLRQAALPELVQERTGPDSVRLAWKVPGGGPFPVPVEVSTDGRVQQVAMPGGRGIFTAGIGQHVVLDPGARILKRSVAVEEYQAWQAAQKTK